MKEVQDLVKKIGMQRLLWELANIINSTGKDETEMRLRYSSQFSHDLFHSTAGDRHEPLDKPQEK